MLRAELAADTATNLSAHLVCIQHVKFACEFEPGASIKSADIVYTDHKGRSLKGLLSCANQQVDSLVCNLIITNSRCHRHDMTDTRRRLANCLPIYLPGIS